jgi:hypothetical protein
MSEQPQEESATEGADEIALEPAGDPRSVGEDVSPAGRGPSADVNPSASE